ncbi:hypothetical protein Ciccas_012072 [Cichlidogyrus casuarinus]|uniref:Uncharacterized protein n=1 Tax=Cichlidogyrus casuarinus TaxID=1844966 RepID=A0ABD2PPE8_9PLAT
MQVLEKLNKGEIYGALQLIINWTTFRNDESKDLLLNEEWKEVLFSLQKMLLDTENMEVLQFLLRSIHALVLNSHKLITIRDCQVILAATFQIFTRWKSSVDPLITLKLINCLAPTFLLTKAQFRPFVRSALEGVLFMYKYTKTGLRDEFYKVFNEILELEPEISYPIMKPYLKAFCSDTLNRRFRTQKSSIHMCLVMNSPVQKFVLARAERAILFGNCYLMLRGDIMASLCRIKSSHLKMTFLFRLSRDADLFSYCLKTRILHKCFENECFNDVEYDLLELIMTENGESVWLDLPMKLPFEQASEKFHQGTMCMRAQQKIYEIPD